MACIYISSSCIPFVNAYVRVLLSFHFPLVNHPEGKREVGRGEGLITGIAWGQGSVSDP